MTAAAPILSTLTGESIELSKPISIPSKAIAIHSKQTKSTEEDPDAALSISKLIAKWGTPPISQSPLSSNLAQLLESAGTTLDVSKINLNLLPKGSPLAKAQTPVTSQSPSNKQLTPKKLDVSLDAASVSAVVGSLGSVSVASALSETPKQSEAVSAYHSVNPTKYKTFHFQDEKVQRKPTTLTTFNLQSWILYHEQKRSEPITTFTFFANEPVRGVYTTYRTYIFRHAEAASPAIHPASALSETL